MPELASRDHIRRVLPLTRAGPRRGRRARSATIDAVAYTRGPGLAGALLVGAGVACSLAAALAAAGRSACITSKATCCRRSCRPIRRAFPFVALLVSGGHTQLMRVDDVGRYELLGETIDDAAGEAFDKSAKLLGLGYPGGPALARLAEFGDPRRVRAAAAAAAQRQSRLLVRRPEDRGAHAGREARHAMSASRTRADLAASTQAGDRRRAGREVDARRCARPACERLVVAGGVGANARLRERARTPNARSARFTGALPGAGAVHRQRRDDRARRGDAAAARHRLRRRPTTRSTCCRAGRWRRRA